MNKKIILGSSSEYRKTLLQSLGVSFECHSPNIDETPLYQECATDLVERLSIAKAFAVHHDRQQKGIVEETAIITSDQVAK